MAYSLRFSLVTTKNTKHSRISLLTPQTNFLHAPADLRLPCNNQLSGLIAERAFRRGLLLYNHDDKIEGLWPTLQSMRNVENSALLKLL